MTETMQTIKDLMKHQHISQRNMAEKVGVAEATMSRWINGTRNPDIQYVERMIKILSYKLSYGDMYKHGRWIKCINENGQAFYLCSVCKCGEEESSNWCPNCGSKNGGAE